MSTTPASAPSSRVRPALPTDVPAVHRLIVELAVYERAEHLVRYDADQLRASLFGPDPDAMALVGEVDGTVAGIAIYYRSFSTWEGPGIYLEDLFVTPDVRGSGLGRDLLAAVAGVAVDRGYARVEWAVLDWNTPARTFYDRIGAAALSEWEMRRLSGDALRECAALART